MIEEIDRELCTGCDACYNICPMKCIKMTYDEMGFRYPEVDFDKCIKCEKCTMTCPSLNKPLLDDKWKEPKIYAAWSLNEDIRFTSTSGGVFSELAKAVIENEGLVVGAAYNEHFLVKHYMIEDLEGIEKLKQSKYVQSDVGDILQKVKGKLDSGKLVAFSGSPCQVSGLINFLKKNYDNLITFDFVCRGMNSPKAYFKYLEMLENKYNSKIKRVWFKNKTYGWNRFSTRIDFENGRIYIKDRYHDLFMRGYIEENLYMRPCCFECKNKGFPRAADITLADFWGAGYSDASLDSDKGTSLIMINSGKGDKLFEYIRERIFRKESSLSAALPGNACIVKSATRNSKSKEFLMMLDQYSFDFSFNKCVENTRYKRVKRKVMREVRFYISRIKGKLKILIK